MIALQAHYTAVELVNFNITGIPTTARRIREKAKRENWPFKVVKGVGGEKMLFEHDGLPHALRNAIYWAAKHPSKAKKSTVPTRPKYADDEVIAAHLYILGQVTDLGEATGISFSQSATTITDKYKAGVLDEPDWVRGVIQNNLSLRTINRWKLDKNKHGAEGLKPKRQGPKGTSIWDENPNLRTIVLGHITENAFANCTHIHKDLVALGLSDIPSVRTLQAYVQKFKGNLRNKKHLLAVHNPDEFRSHHQPAFGDPYENITRINQLWEVDGTIADVICELPDGKTVRYSLTGMIDIFTRRPRVLVSDIRRRPHPRSCFF